MNVYVKILTRVHVVISLIAIVAGFVSVIRQIKGRPFDRWTRWFLLNTFLTSVTGFFFPFKGVTPAFIFGVISLLVLSVTFYALHAGKLARPWNWIFSLTAIFAFYLNFFVLIVQAFLKIPFLHDLAPQQNEPPFAIAQLLALIGFGRMGFLAVRQSIRSAAIS
jgi:hypothetical protein